MKPSFVLSILIAALFPSVATAQLHGTREAADRNREPGLHDGTIEALIAGALEQAHKAETWRKKEAATFNLRLELADNEPENVLAVFATDGPALTVSVGGKPAFGHDGETPWETPVAEALGDAAIHLRMLGQLPALPYRLHERNIYNSRPARTVNERRCHVMSIQRAENDNWTILLVDSHTNLLHAAAYFIRTSEEDEPAFSPAFAMVAEGYEEVCDVPLPKAWTIWRWSRPRGIVGEKPIGTVHVLEARFVEVDDNAFKSPQSAPDVDASGDDE